MKNFDLGTILRHEYTPEGYLNCYMRVGRIGELKYTRYDGTEQIQVVEPDVLFAKDSIDSLKSKVVTDDHPPIKVDARNTKQFARGMTTPYVVIDGDFLGVIATVTDHDLIQKIVSGEQSEVSAGYATELEEMADGKYRQKFRKYNHVSIVAKGRAGKDVKVQLDSTDWQSEKISENTDVNVNFDTFFAVTNKSKSYMKFKLNGFQFDTEDSSLVEAAKAVNSQLETLSGQVDSFKLNTDSLESTSTKLKADFDKAIEENKVLSEKLEAAEAKILNLDSKSTESTAETVAFWVEVLPKLQMYNPNYQPDYSVTKAEVQKLLLNVMFPTLNFDSKSSDYIQGFYENALMQKAESKVEVKEEPKEDSEETEQLNTDSKSPLKETLANLYKSRQTESSGLNASIEAYKSNLEGAWKN